MLPNLSPIKESIWIKIILTSVLTCMIGGLTFYISLQLIPDAPLYAIVSASSLALLTSILIGKYIAQDALRGTDYLARLILLSSRQENYQEVPSDDNLGPGKDYLLELAKNIYSISDHAVAQPSQSETYKKVIETLPLPMIVLAKDRTISYLNEAAERYIEKPKNEVLGKPFYDSLNLSFVSNLTLDSWLEETKDNSVTDDEIWERVRLSLPEERRRQFDLVAHYSNNDSDGAETTLLFFDRTREYDKDDHDLTFVSLAVHELRTPLTIMRGYIEVFEDEISGSLNPEQTTFMHNMSASAQQLTAFVAKVLNVARVEENALTLRLKEENWNELLVNTCRDMELRAQVRNKKLIYEIAENLPTVAVDKVSIYEVLANLIENAIKYTHTDENIVISSYEKDGMIETTVSDKGVGIPDNIMPHVFDKFYRSHNSKNSVGGTGLGLYLCRAIISSHGGTIWVKSKEGEGSTFGFTLPIYENVKDQVTDEQSGIVRGAHGWIKNHSLYRE
jgi:signal transduction histidine kinase